MIVEYPERARDRFRIYETSESYLDERIKLDDRLDDYKARLARDKHELETTKGFIARLRIKQRIREDEDIIAHLEESVNHWYPIVHCFPQREP